MSEAVSTRAALCCPLDVPSADFRRLRSSERSSDRFAHRNRTWHGRLAQQPLRLPECKNGNIERFRAKGTTFVPPRIGAAVAADLVLAADQSRSKIAITMVWTKGAGETMHIPSFFSYWASSAARNAGFADFFMFHLPGVRELFDERLHDRPANVRYIEIANLIGLYQNKLNVSSPMTTSIIKDLKPVIGLVFEEYLYEYSHWAFSDADVIFGDLRKFLTPSVLAFDISSVISDHFCSRAYKTLFAGQLTVFKNNDWTKFLFKSVPGWADIFARPKAVFFDERNMPAYVLRTTPERVAFVFAQISDHRGALRNSHIIWRDGRLLTLGSEGCIMREDALVHLSNLNHNKNALRANVFASGPRDRDGFMIDVSGLRPWQTIASNSHIGTTACTRNFI